MVKLLSWSLLFWNRLPCGRLAGRRAALGIVALAACAGVMLAAGSASAAWDDDIVSVADLQAGGSFLSDDGTLEFSDFDFTAVGFDDSVFDTFLVQPREQGFRLILGFGDLFGPGSLEMSYTVSAGKSAGIDSASIPFLALIEAVGASPLEVGWGASNGASLFGSSDDTVNFPWPGVSTDFDPVGSLMVDQIVTLSRGSGIAKVENAFDVVAVPEAGSGVLLAMGLFAALAGARRSR